MKNNIKVTASSNWQKPQVFWVETEDEAEDLRKELRDQQFLVEIEQVFESDKQNK